MNKLLVTIVLTNDRAVSYQGSVALVCLIDIITMEEWKYTYQILITIPTPEMENYVINPGRLDE